MTDLNDTQRILLSSASQRDSGSLLPVKPSLKRAGERVIAAIAELTVLGLAEERETADAKAVHRSDGNHRYGVFITDVGLRLIDAGPGDDEKPDPVAPPARASKSAAVVALLQRANGATVPELIEATGWLPHTTRAALTGLRHKGHVIERSKRDGATCYRIVAVAA